MESGAKTATKETCTVVHPTLARNYRLECSPGLLQQKLITNIQNG
ncbi:MAG: hypothetical protein NVS3B20_25760 [Polyangiales bacterium]